MKSSRFLCVVALMACATGCIYVDEDGPSFVEEEKPDDILSVPFETTQLAMHTKFDTHRSLRDGRMVAVYDAWFVLHEEQHESYCLLAESRDVAPLYGGAQVLIKIEAELDDPERELYSREVEGVCPVGQYLISGDGEVYSSSYWDDRTRDPNLRSGEGRYRRWDGSGAPVSEEEGRTGYVEVTQTAKGCVVDVDINLGKRIHAVYKTTLPIDVDESNSCDL